MNSITYAETAQHKPIDLLFRGAVDTKSKEKKVQFVDVVEILNDRYLGRMNASNYFAVAENTVRINELNLLAVEELANYHLAMRKNFLIPERTVYCLPITTRFLDSDEDFALLLNALKTAGYKKGRLILSFFGVSLDRLSEDAKKRYMRLRRGGYKTASAQFGEDFNSLDVFTGVTFDYLRCEAGYFDTTPKKKKLLSMLVRFCNANKMTLIIDGVNTPQQYTRFKKAGVKLVTGESASKETAYVTNKFLGVAEPAGEKKTAYLARLKKELDTKERAEFVELEKMRKDALERIKNSEAEGILPTTSRPEIEKSPYQIRLERQREIARECAGARLRAISMIAEERGDDVEELLYKVTDNVASAPSEGESAPEEMGENKIRYDSEGNPYIGKRESGITAPMRPENDEKKKIEADLDAEAKLIDEFRNDGLMKNLDGGVQTRIEGEESGLEIAVAPEKTEATADLTKEESDGNAQNSALDDGNSGESGAEDAESALKENENNSGSDDGADSLTGDENENQNDDSAETSTEGETDSQSDDDTETALEDESDGRSDDPETAIEDGSNSKSNEVAEVAGVEMTLVSEEGIPLVGSYNERAQWTDRDGNVFDGYFDEKGKWIEYEKPDPTTEGHYNEYGQWVDGDGRIYDGYFDEKGRWIDYTFSDANGEVVDNGYFDDKIGKWIAFGYFDGRGAYHKL